MGISQKSLIQFIKSVSSPKIIYTLVYALTLLILLADSYSSSNSVQKFLSVSSRQVFIYALILLGMLRFFDNQRLPKIVFKLNTFLIFPIFLIVCIALTIFDYKTPPNAAYDLVRINYMQLCIISMYCIVTATLQQTNQWFLKYYKCVIFTSFFVVFGYAYLSTLFPYDIFYNISKEDKLIENLQFFVLIAGAFFSGLIAKRLPKTHKSHGIIFVLITIGLFLIAGDEISWGQRVFNLTTPEIVATNNDQGEITIHNLSSFAGLVGLGYILIGFYGAFAWISQVFFPKLRKIPFMLYIPGWYCIGYFFLGFLFNYYNRTVQYHPYAVWSEFAELMLYSGIMLALVGICITIKRSRNR